MKLPYSNKSESINLFLGIGVAKTSHNMASLSYSSIENIRTLQPTFSDPFDKID